MSREVFSGSAQDPAEIGNVVGRESDLTIAKMAGALMSLCSILERQEQRLKALEDCSRRPKEIPRYNKGGRIPYGVCESCKKPWSGWSLIYGHDMCTCGGNIVMTDEEEGKNENNPA
jgi:hypothetical protein